MKIIYILPLLFTAITLKSQVINIPDPNFKNFLLNNSLINLNNDLEIELVEAETFNGSIDCSSLSIESLEGIEYFSNITSLNCSNNEIIALDVSACSNLEFLQAESNLLVSLNVSSLENLSFLRAGSNELIDLNLFDNLNLDFVDCGYNNLSILTLPPNSIITSLNIEGNNLAFLDVQNLPDIQALFASFNELTELDCSNLVSLETLGCADNNLNTLNLSNCSSLISLNCLSNELESLDLASCVNLAIIQCALNNFTFLNFDNNPHLTQFIGYDNPYLEAISIQNGSNNLISSFIATNCPNLLCVQVDDVENAEQNWTEVPTQAVFSISCSSILDVHSEVSLSNPSIYLNTPNRNLFISELPIDCNLYIFDIQGRVLSEISNISSKTQEISLVPFPTGLYFFVVTSEVGTFSWRFIID